MKKRGLLFAVLALAMAACLAILPACGQSSQPTKASSETFDVSGEPSTEEPVVLRTDPFYVLVVGNDTREGTVNLKGQYADGKGRADTMMLVRVNPTKYTFDLITVPRDTATEYDGETIKLNEVFERGGIDALKKEVKKLTSVAPDYYVVTTFVGFQDIIDSMKGITANVPIPESMEDIVTGELMEFGPGEMELNGAQALIFARERHYYEVDQDAYRQTNDRYILQTMIEKLLASPDTVADLVENTLYKDIDSDLTSRELAAYAEEFANNAKKVKFTSCTGPYSGELDYTVDKWLAYRDEDTWKSVIKAVEAGEDPTEIVPILTYNTAADTGAAEGEAAAE